MPIPRKFNPVKEQYWKDQEKS